MDSGGRFRCIYHNAGDHAERSPVREQTSPGKQTSPVDSAGGGTARNACAGGVCVMRNR